MNRRVSPIVMMILISIIKIKLTMQCSHTYIYMIQEDDSPRSLSVWENCGIPEDGVCACIHDIQYKCTKGFGLIMYIFYFFTVYIYLYWTIFQYCTSTLIHVLNKRPCKTSSIQVLIISFERFSPPYHSGLERRGIITNLCASWSNYSAHVAVGVHRNFL